MHIASTLAQRSSLSLAYWDPKVGQHKTFMTTHGGLVLPFLLKRRDDTYFAFSKAFFADIIFKKRKDDLKCEKILCPQRAVSVVCCQIERIFSIMICPG